MLSRPASPYIEVDLAGQRLWLRHGHRVLMECRVSTAKNGAGEIEDSQCTPRGVHAICEKIGAGCPTNTVFVARRPTGELYAPELRVRFPGRDWILTRILWLRGLEPGRNCGGRVDSRTRFIYIHGTPDDTLIGVPGSRGCIRMRNLEIEELFERVEIGTMVLISDSGISASEALDPRL